MIEDRRSAVSDAEPDLEADRLWPQARRMAEHWCAATIRRLHRGDGGFYEADDLLQDLYLEFRDVVARWRADDDRDDVQALWSAWSRRLWGGGQRVLRRQPQHLWVRQEEPMDPTDMGRAIEARMARDDESPVEPAKVGEALAGLDRLDAALWSLPVLNRQVVYMMCLRRQPAPDIAQWLGLSGAEAVYVLLRRARRRLRPLLDRPRRRTARRTTRRKAQGDNDTSLSAAASAPHVCQS
jgi:DNA-directed RNA polymerase specialized sigma24 family protein